LLVLKVDSHFCDFFFDTMSIDAYINIIFYVYSFFFLSYCKCNVVFDIKIYTTLRGLLTNKQSTEKESRYVRKHDKLFTIIGNKSKYIFRVLYETSLSVKGRNCYRDFYSVYTVTFK